MRTSGTAEPRAASGGPSPDMSAHSVEALLLREREARERAAFLAESSRLLAASLDYETTLATVAGLALPHLGAWCFVDLLGPGDVMRRLAVIHPDPEMQLLARRLESGWPPMRDDPFGVPHAVRTRRSEIIERVPETMLERAAHGEENRRILRQLGIGSLIMVPLIARDEVLGAITYVAPTAHHSYTDADLLLAEDLAARCAIAIDNARLFERVQVARAEAEDANRAKTLFLSTMSHELRTPLNAIAGYAELLEMDVHGPLSREHRRAVHRIQVNQRHLLGLVNSVLDYARVEAGRMEYALRPVRLAEVLDHVETLIEPLSKKRGIDYPRVVGDQNLIAHADPEKLQQILVNLIVNAIKFTPEAGTITVECVAEEERVLVRVRDTGIGIEPDHREAIFQPFVQVREGLTRTEEGTGLGLSISRSLARGMGGELGVESEVGSGSTFTLALPRVNESTKET